ncbi:MAG: inositol monophosphatase family protein, partial [bacterium]
MSDSAAAQDTVETEFVETAVAAADAARQVALMHFRAGVNIERKPDRTPVTVADRESEQRIKEVILARHPQHGFLGEESGASDGDGEWRWVIDPIDGTKSFATGNPTFGALIARLRRGEPVLGVIDPAALEERGVGVARSATTPNATRCAPNTVAQIAD